MLPSRYVIWICHVTTAADSIQNDIINLCTNANEGDEIIYVCVFSPLLLPKR